MLGKNNLVSGLKHYEVNPMINLEARFDVQMKITDRDKNNHDVLVENISYVDHAAREHFSKARMQSGIGYHQCMIVTEVVIGAPEIEGHLRKLCKAENDCEIERHIYNPLNTLFEDYAATSVDHETVLYLVNSDCLKIDYAIVGLPDNDKSI